MSDYDDEVFGAGREAERAAIVAWLREAVKREAPTGRPVYMLVEAAEQIEAGEHLSHLKGNEG